MPLNYSWFAVHDVEDLDLVDFELTESKQEVQMG